MTFTTFICAFLIGIVTVAGAKAHKPLIITSQDDLSAQFCQMLTEKRACEPIRPIQPTPSDFPFINRVYDTSRADFEYSFDGDGQKTILVDGVPFERYWQFKSANKYVFHPLLWGLHVFENADNAEFRSNLDRFVDLTSYSLPNGGLVFYYPNFYPLNRMRGPDVMYSAISQSEILAGFLNVEKFSSAIHSTNNSQAVLNGLLFPYREGGVNLDNIAFLELPMFRSNPEIILNGWLHALLHLNDWAITKEDEKASQLIEDNLSFFVENHDAWYDHDRNILRYSDTSPIRVNFIGKSKDQDIRVIYEGKHDQLKAYVFEPVIEDKDTQYSGYDTRIVSRKGKTVKLGVNCSQLFDTIIVSDKPFKIEARTHAYDETRATPKPKGKWKKHSATKQAESVFSFNLNRVEESFICGYPTNFSKSNGKNFYHSQHIVALRYLAEFGYFDNDALKEQLRTISEKWRVKTANYNVRPLDDFETLQRVLDAINGGKFINQAKTISDLGLSEYGE